MNRHTLLSFLGDRRIPGRSGRLVASHKRLGRTKRSRHLTLELLDKRVLLAVWYADDDAAGNPLQDGSQANPFDTIQEGSDAAAVSGDTLHVAGGTYYERLVWDLKSIALVGAGAEITTVDAEAQGRCLTMSNVPNTARIEGLTFTGGDAFQATRATRAGGGLWLYKSSPTLENNVITGNQALWGGGISVESVSSPQLLNNLISENSAIGAHAVGGGARFASGATVHLSGNSITENTADKYGGGIDTWYAAATLEGNRITGNSARYGAGLRLDTSSVSLLSDEIIGNEADDIGGGVYAQDSQGIQSQVQARAVTIQGNSARRNAGGIYVDASSLDLRDSIVSDNTSTTGSGGGIALQYGTTATIVGNSIVGNQSSLSGGGVMSGNNSTIAFTNNDVRG